MLNQTRNPGESVNFRCQVRIRDKYLVKISQFLLFQIDMSKCMVAFIDWYHESLDGSPRKKVKVSSNLRLSLIKIDVGRNIIL